MPFKVKHVVADTGAFIRNANLREIAENVYTVPQVIEESIDRATRRRLNLLPISINFKEPSTEALQFVSAFAKKTGDYLSLSAVDLKVLALVYDLEKQFKGTDHINKDPPTKSQYVVGGTSDSSGVKLAVKQYAEGEALPSNLIGEKNADESDDEEICDEVEDTDEDKETLNKGEDVEKEKSDSNKNTEELEGKKEDSESDNCDIKEHFNEDSNAENESEEGEDEEDDDEEEDDGWITPGNITEVKKSMGVETTSEDEVCVGCLTTDFAMQNVLIQMGLNILSVDGMLIKKAKSYVLRCFGCLRITKDTSRVFCPHCGNRTLKRLSTTIEQDGSVKYWLAKNYTIRTKGMKYSLPKPQGGKHAMNPILCADQPVPDQRPSKKSLQKIDVLSQDIIADMSPFTINDVTSRAAQLGITGRQWSKRNPNDGYRRLNKRKGK
ncbi:Nin1 binding protein [Biomphalaria glabrata]|uniref:RNA-binding protein NOB1 n=2 Tax=Biomphalaria glabrata TaxID=6526 RepID=A0A9W3ATW6_BIOGL|nr:RNA-binding protein NOB1-like [Biomphalaria glabrata]KAI8762241.1 RNA-binding protein NOB1-like [Biomphalaria glabrata]